MKIIFFGDSITRGDPGASYFDILEQELPEDTLVNYGRGGDTVTSLRRRIMGVSWDGQFDLSFVWAGVNDIVFNVDWSDPINDDSVKRPWSELIKDMSGFYGPMLEDVLVISRKVVTVPPLFVGEETNNIFSKVLEVIAVSIERLTGQYENAEYLDLRSIVKFELEGKDSPASIAGTINKDSEDKSVPLKPIAGNALWQGKLHYTIDGVHLNNAGARLVAEVFLEKIKSISKEMD